MNRPRRRRRNGLIEIAMLVAMVPVVSGALAGHYVWGTIEEMRLLKEVQQLRKAGQPMWPRDCNNRKLPDDQNAALDLLAVEKIARMDGHDGEWLSNLNPARKLTEAELTRLNKILKDRQPALDRAKAAAAKNDGEWGIVIKSPVMMTLLPSLNNERMLSWLFRAAAIAAHARGHDDEAVQWGLVTAKQARFVGRQPFLVSQLVATAISVSGVDLIERMLPTLHFGTGAGEVAPQQVKAMIAELMNDQAWRENWHRDMQFERMSDVDCCYAVIAGRLGFNGKYMDNAQHGIAEIATGYLIRPLAFADTRWIIETMSQVIEAGDKTSYSAALASLPAEATPQGWPASNDYVHPLARLIMPSVDRAMLTEFRGQTLRHLLATTLAIRCYMADHDGNAPETLQELSPKYLAGVPIDPFADGEATLRYKDKAIVYSLGEDGADDNGNSAGGRWNSKDVVMRVK